jgi:hypothetical protein
MTAQKLKMKQLELKPVSANSFYSVVPTKSFKDWDEELELAPAFLVDKEGTLMRSEQLQKMEEQVT